MTSYDCTALASRYQQGKCAGVLPASYASKPVVWIGPGCPTPCAQQAAKTGANPRAFCAKQGKQPTWQDGGCKLANDCVIYCQDTCVKQPWCKWRGNLCKLKTEYE